MADELTPEQPKSEGDKLFDALAGRTGVQPPINVELPEDTGDSGEDAGGFETLEDRINNGKKRSDFEIANATAFPDLGHKHLNLMQMSRVFPDVFNPLLRIQVKSLIRDNPGMSVAEAIAYVNTSLTIAIDGEGRIDLIHMFGRSSDVEETRAKNIPGL